MKKCCLRVPALLNSRLHSEHLKSLCPECINMCCLRLPARLQENLHCAQLKGFSPVWTSKCVFRIPMFIVEKPQVLQVWYFLPSVMARDWVSPVFHIVAIWINLLSYISQQSWGTLRLFISKISKSKWFTQFINFPFLATLSRQQINKLSGTFFQHSIGFGCPP